MFDDPELERQLRAFGMTLQHEVGEPIEGPAVAGASSAMTTDPDTNDERSRFGGSRPWAAAAAVVMVVVGLGVLASVRGGDAPDQTPASQPDVEASTSTVLDSSTSTDVETSVVSTTVGTGPALVDPGAVIDPSRLRFSDPLEDDTAAFFDDPSLPVPRVVAPVTDGVEGGEGGPDREVNDSVSIVVMGDTRFVMRAAVVDATGDDVVADGEPVDVGVDGARYVDADAGAIVIPLNAGLRVVAPEEYFAFGGGGPFVDADTLVGLAASIGQRPLDEIDSIDGVYVFDGQVDGEPVGLFTPDNVIVNQGASNGPTYTTTLVRLPEPPTALDLFALVRGLNRGQIDPGEVGDISFTAGPSGYIELVSPVDLLIATAPDDIARVLDRLTFAPLSDLATTAEQESPTRSSEPSGLTSLLEGVAWEASGIERNCGAGEFPMCTQVVHDPNGDPISYDPTTRQLTRHVRHDGQFVTAVLPLDFGQVWLVAAGPDDIVYLNAVFDPGDAEGAADLVAMSLAPGDNGREVDRVVGGGNPGVDFDFVATPTGLLTTDWYGQGQRPAPDRSLVMPWADRDPTDDNSPAPGVDDTPNGVASITIDAYERTVTVNDRTWTLTGQAAEFAQRGMPPIVATFDGGFLARYDTDPEGSRSIVVRGRPDGTVDEWAVPDIPPGFSTVVPEPMGTVLIAGDEWFARAAPFQPPATWDGRLDVDPETGSADVTELNQYLSMIEPDQWPGDPVAFAEHVLGAPSSPAEVVTIDHALSTNDIETIVVTHERFLDDSTYGTRWTITVRPDLRNVISIERTITCQPDRGHQDYQPDSCI